MTRILSVVLVAALTVASSTAALLHTHDYADHDHPGHHHGLAAHDHAALDHHDHDNDGTPHLEGCEPGQHRVSLSFVSAAAAPALQFFATIEDSLPLTPLRSLERTVAVADVRAHGPPPRRSSAPRAPPLTRS
jgi:hypothetical protein